MKNRLDGSEYWSDSLLREKTSNEIFVDDWLQVLFFANKGGPISLDHIEWDGKGPCPGCGITNPRVVSQSLVCTSCRSVFSINQKDINHGIETYVLCHKCNSKMVIPPTVWCQKCGQNLRPGNIFLKLFEEANQKTITGAVKNQKKSMETKRDKTLKSKKSKIISTFVVLVIALIWWSILIDKNPSGLGPGIKLGHLIQFGVISLIAFVIIRKIWRK